MSPVRAASRRWPRAPQPSSTAAAAVAPSRSPTAPGDLARRSAGAARRAPPSGHRALGPSAALTGSTYRCPGVFPRRQQNQMMIVMKPTATEEEIQAVIDRIESVGARAHPSRGEEVTVIGAIGDREHVARLGLEGAPGRRAGRADPQAVQALLARSSSGGERTVHRDRGPQDRRRALLAHRRAVHGRVARPGADRGARSSRPAARACSAAAPTSRAPRRTRSRASGRRACACWPRRRRRPACRSSPS